MRFRILLPIVTVCLLPLSACGGGGSGSGTPSGSSNRAPVISGGNQTVLVAENSSGTLFTATATDADGDTITFSLSGGDAGLFTVTSSGAVSFLSSPNYDLPTDDNSDNVYSFNVVVSDGKASSSIAAQVTVTNDREGISVKRLSQSVSAGAVVGLNNQSGKLFVVGQDGNMSLLDPDGGSQAVPGNAFFSGETGRVMAAVSDRSWMFVMLSIDGQGEVVRFFHATNSSYANPTATLAAEVDADVTGSLAYASGYLYAALGDSAGNLAQDAASGFGKFYRIDFDPYCGASLYSICLGATRLGDGIHKPFGLGEFGGKAFLFDRGSDAQDEVTYFDQNTNPLDFGWPYYEGTKALISNPPATINAPFLSFTRGTGFGESNGLVGGAVYSGAIASINDKLIFADDSGRILDAPVSFLSDGAVHFGTETEDRTEDFAPDTGDLGEPVNVLMSGTGRLFIINADGAIFEVIAG